MIEFQRKVILITDGYEEELEEILSIQEQFSPLDHIKKFEIIKGDIIKTLPKYLKENSAQCFLSIL